jgi:hypothetical protein
VDIYPPEVDSFTIENTAQESKKLDQEKWTQEQQQLQQQLQQKEKKLSPGGRGSRNTKKPSARPLKAPAGDS